MVSNKRIPWARIGSRKFLKVLFYYCRFFSKTLTTDLEQLEFHVLA